MSFRLIKVNDKKKNALSSTMIYEVYQQVEVIDGKQSVVWLQAL